MCLTIFVGQWSIFSALEGPDGPHKIRVDLKECPDCSHRPQARIWSRLSHVVIASMCQSRTDDPSGRPQTDIFHWFELCSTAVQLKTHLKSLIRLLGLISTDYEPVNSILDPFRNTFGEIGGNEFSTFQPSLVLKKLN